jgi:AcrR family transcriptional regulator
VPRTIDPEAHAVRRDSFVDSAQRLLQAKGYERMSIQDVLDDVGASRGAFYHYFSSKADLLEAVVTRVVDRSLAAVAPVMDDPVLDAVTRLEGVFGGIARWKTERSELMLALTRVWASDENALARDKMWRRLDARFTPLLARIVHEGDEEGVFSVSSPESTARVVVALLHGLNDAAVRLFLDRATGAATLADAEGLARAYVDALERILGLAPKTLHLVDPSALKEWYR